ncbi:MAG: glycosyltransferase, partial [Nitrosarchaeum sp.]
IIMADGHFRIDLKRGPQLQNTFDNSTIIRTFEGELKQFNSKIYPYTNMQANEDAAKIEIREWIRVK